MKFLKTKSIKLISFILFFAVFLFSVNFLHNIAHSDNCDLACIEKQLVDLRTALSLSQNATKPLQTQLTSLKSQLAAIDSQVAQIEKDLIVKKKNIDEGYKNLESKQRLFNITVKNTYIKNYTFSPLLIFLSGNNASDITSILTYQKRNTEQDKNIITNIALLLVDLEQKKADLESSQQRLAIAKTTLDKERADVQKVVDGAVAYQNTLSSQIAVLSAKQQDILAQKLGSLGLPTSAYTTSGGCSSDLTNNKDPGFSPRFGFFTFGVPHRVGMSQYGAKGRADAGQNNDAILHAYYNFDNYQNTSATIKVNDGKGFNTGNIIWTGGLDDYVKRIYEVPDNWPIEVLKAQAIAARSYALATTNNGDMSICATQDCQVFKTDPKGGNWENAVNQTAGQVMMQGGKPIQAWFSSTAGGYEFSSGDVWGGSSKPWTKNVLDANGSVSSFSDLQNNAYDKSSPWFYCDWGSRSQYAGTAWLRPEEVADIVNSILLVQADGSTDPHILQTDKNDPNMWSEGKVKEELSKYRTPFNAISSSSVDANFGSGRTTTVHFSGDAGSVDFSSDVFKKYFNLRAPANINIVGLLYNAEKR